MVIIENVKMYPFQVLKLNRVFFLLFQVVSPVTGRVLGTKEIRVLNERVSISGMKVQVISGVQLSLFPDTDSDNQFVAETTMTSKLSAKYQVCG